MYIKSVDDFYEEGIDDLASEDLLRLNELFLEKVGFQPDVRFAIFKLRKIWNNYVITN